MGDIDVDDTDTGDSRQGISISIDMLQDIGWIMILGFGAVGCVCCVLLILCVRCRRNKRRKLSRHAQKIKSREDMPEMGGYPADGLDDGTYSGTKKSTYSTVSVGDGEELFLEHPQGVHSSGMQIVSVHGHSGHNGHNGQTSSSTQMGQMANVYMSQVPRVGNRVKLIKKPRTHIRSEERKKGIVVGAVGVITEDSGTVDGL